MAIFPFSKFIIHGNSMLPTLKPGQDVLCFNWAYVFLKPKAGDIVVVRQNSREIIKRVHMYKNSRIYVRGDNAKESTDSRNFGEINDSQIDGRVILIR